jgi:hypothetical protein
MTRSTIVTQTQHVWTPSVPISVNATKDILISAETHGYAKILTSAVVRRLAMHRHVIRYHQFAKILRVISHVFANVVLNSQERPVSTLTNVRVMLTGVLRQQYVSMKKVPISVNATKDILLSPHGHRLLSPQNAKILMSVLSRFQTIAELTHLARIPTDHIPVVVMMVIILRLGVFCVRTSMNVSMQMVVAGGEATKATPYAQICLVVVSAVIAQTIYQKEIQKKSVTALNLKLAHRIQLERNLISMRQSSKQVTVKHLQSGFTIDLV